MNEDIIPPPTEKSKKAYQRSKRQVDELLHRLTDDNDENDPKSSNKEKPQSNVTSPEVAYGDDKPKSDFRKKFEERKKNI